MYDAVSDPYCYPGTTVLKNRANILTQAELDHFEEEATAQRFAEPLPRGRLTDPLVLDRLDPQEMLRATIAGFEGDEKPLAAVIRGLVT